MHKKHSEQCTHIHMNPQRHIHMWSQRFVEEILFQGCKKLRWVEVTDILYAWVTSQFVRCVITIAMLLLGWLNDLFLSMWDKCLTFPGQRPRGSSLPHPDALGLWGLPFIGETSPWRLANFIWNKMWGSLVRFHLNFWCPQGCAATACSVHSEYLKGQFTLVTSRVSYPDETPHMAPFCLHQAMFMSPPLTSWNVWLVLDFQGYMLITSIGRWPVVIVIDVNWQKVRWLEELLRSGLKANGKWTQSSGPNCILTWDHFIGSGRDPSGNWVFM